MKFIKFAIDVFLVVMTIGIMNARLMIMPFKNMDKADYRWEQQHKSGKNEEYVL